MNLAAIARSASRSLDNSPVLGTRLRDQFSADQARSRRRNLKRWYREGGRYFADWSEQWYRRPPDGIPISWAEPYLRPLYLCLGNPWVEFLVVQKPAQVFFSETLINLAAFTLAELRSPGGMGFEREAKLRDMVGPRIQTAFDFVEPIREIKRRRLEVTGRSDTDLKSRVITVGGNTFTFFYASTSQKAGGTERQASSSISSWTGYVMLCDEIELWPEGVVDVAKSRQLSFKPPLYPTRPFRAGSTPGHEGGVTDREVRTCDRFFQWHVTCPHCKAMQVLDVFGNFLLPERGVDGDRFLSAAGRPLDWFCGDRTNSVTRQRSAYVGCRECGGELDWAARSAGEYRCSYTGEVMLEVLDALCRDRRTLRRVALEITPLSSSRFDPAATILDLQQSRNPADTVQQVLGKPVSLGSGKIQLATVQQAIARPVPEMECDRVLTVIGADQGREGHWAVATRWHLPIADDFEAAWRDAFVEVLDCDRLHGFEGIEAWRSRFGADLVGLDFKPEVSLAADYARQRSEDLQPAPAQPFVPLPDGSFRVAIARSPGLVADWLAGLGWRLLPDGDDWRLLPISGLAQPVRAIARQGRRICEMRFLDAKAARSPGRAIYLFDQCALKGEPFRRATRNVQGEDVPVWALHRTFGLDAVRDRAIANRLSLPDGTIYNPADSGNFILHLLTSDRTPNGQWVEAPGQPDHYFHALNFAEMAVLCSHYEPQPGGHLAIASLGSR